MTVAIVELIQAAVAFTWLGLVLAISFVDTPLKFPAPGSPCRSVPVSVGWSSEPSTLRNWSSPPRYSSALRCGR
jgi:ABC-type molybdate transport system permease subunit